MHGMLQIGEFEFNRNQFQPNYLRYITQLTLITLSELFLTVYLILLELVDGVMTTLLRRTILWLIFECLGHLPHDKQSDADPMSALIVVYKCYY